MSVADRLEGLCLEQLIELRRQAAEKIAAIEESGKIEMWVVSTDWMNLHWDTSYERACLFLSREVLKGASNPSRYEYELKPHKIFSAQLSEYSEGYEKEWDRLQKILDSQKAPQ